MAKTEADQRKHPVKFELRNSSYLACPIPGCLFEAQQNSYVPFLQFEKVGEVRARSAQYAEATFNDLHTRLQVHIKECHNNV